MRKFKTVLKLGKFVRKQGEFPRLLELSLLFAGADQLVKSSINQEPEENFPREMPGTRGKVIVKRVKNQGFSMNRFENFPEFVRISSAGITAFFAGILFMLCRLLPGKCHLQKLGLSLSIGGGLSNTLDRFLFHGVTDYLHIQARYFRKRIINLADIFICIGGTLQLLSLLISLGKKDGNSICL